MTAEGAAIYDDFVELLSCFDKVSTHSRRSAWRHCIRTNVRHTCACAQPQSVMLDLVEDALKDAHDSSLLAAYAGSGAGGLADDSTLQ